MRDELFFEQIVVITLIVYFYTEFLTIQKRKNEKNRNVHGGFSIGCKLCRRES